MNKKIWILLIVIIALAAFFRLYQITQIPPGLYPDEAINGNNALQALQTGNFKVFYPENNGREGLFMNIQAIFLKYLMPLENGATAAWMLRLPSALFGILTVLGIYFLAKELFLASQESHPKIIGLLSAFFLATSVWHIIFSRIGFRAIMAPFFLVWAVYFFLLSIRKEKWVLPSLVGGILFGLGFYSYISYRVAPLLFLLFIPYFQKTKSFWKKIATYIVATFAAALPIGIYFLKNPADFFGRTSELFVFAPFKDHPGISSLIVSLKDLAINAAKTALMFNYQGDFNWRQNISGAPELFWPVGIIFLIGLILAILNYKKLWASFSLASLILFALPVIMSNEGIPHALRAILLIPPVFLLVGFGALWIYKKTIQINFKSFKPAKIIINIFVIIFLSICLLQAFEAYFIIWGANPNTASAFNQNYVNIANQINALPAQTQKYVVVEAGGVLVRGIPMPAQTVMFLTNTFLPQNQDAKNIHYLLPSQVDEMISKALQLRSGQAIFQNPISIFYLR